jgi:hypothetical protein
MAAGADQAPRGFRALAVAAIAHALLLLGMDKYAEWDFVSTRCWLLLFFVAAVAAVAGTASRPHAETCVSTADHRYRAVGAVRSHRVHVHSLDDLWFCAVMWPESAARAELCVGRPTLPMT